MKRQIRYAGRVMNTIPLIFNERKVKCAVFGGNERPSVVQMNAAVVLLNENTAHYRTGQLADLLKMGFSEIISVECAADNYSIEDISRRFPSVKFVIPLEPVTAGEMINIGISETAAPYALVVKGALRFSSGMLTPLIMQRLQQHDCLCVVPRLLDSEKNPLPVRYMPTVNKTVFKVQPVLKIYEGCWTLYPFDGIGLYNRRRFIELGGFDYTLTTAYWQLLDFAMRGWLWGERIIFSSLYQFVYEADVPIENTTADMSQLRFFLKNIAPKLREDHAYIPFMRFFNYNRQASCGIGEAYRQFADARQWTEKNQYRFHFDAVKLINAWEYEKT